MHGMKHAVLVQKDSSTGNQRPTMIMGFQLKRWWWWRGRCGTGLQAIQDYRPLLGKDNPGKERYIQGLPERMLRQWQSKLCMFQLNLVCVEVGRLTKAITILWSAGVSRKWAVLAAQERSSDLLPRDSGSSTRGMLADWPRRGCSSDITVGMMTDTVTTYSYTLSLPFKNSVPPMLDNPPFSPFFREALISFFYVLVAI